MKQTEMQTQTALAHTVTPMEAAPYIPKSALTDEQQAVAERVLAGENVFLTGPAGTGKSFLFKYLLQELRHKYGPTSVAITAPTGNNHPF